MKKIVRGNDFTLRIPVCKIVNDEQVAFPLPACTDIVVNIVNQYRRVSLAYAIDTTEDNIINARVEGDAVSVGTYALEVRGKIFGNDWRSKEYEQFAIVDNNASGDTAFNGELIEGEDSVEMNTALVILPPTAELTQLITDANTAIETAKQTDATLKANESQRTIHKCGAITSAIASVAWACSISVLPTVLFAVLAAVLCIWKRRYWLFIVECCAILNIVTTLFI